MVELKLIAAGVGQEIKFVVKRALMQIKINRGRVATVAAEAHIPARDFGVVLHRLDLRLVGHHLFEMSAD